MEVLSGLWLDPPKCSKWGSDRQGTNTCLSMCGKMVPAWLWGSWDFALRFRRCFADSCVQLLPAAWQTHVLECLCVRVGVSAGADVHLPVAI